jgi:hypothetical protein
LLDDAIGCNGTRNTTMTIDTSIFLIAVGAILRYAVTATVAGIDLQTTGVILMAVGVLGLIAGLLAHMRSRSNGHPPPPAAP